MESLQLLEAFKTCPSAVLLPRSQPSLKPKFIFSCTESEIVGTRCTSRFTMNQKPPECFTSGTGQ